MTRPTSWWLEALKKRASSMYEEQLDLSRPVEFASERERVACVAFFNAAFRAEESGFSQAHNLASDVGAWDPDLGECIELYGNEERWHGELVGKFLEHIGGDVRPMGRVTGTLYRAYASATELESIMLTNLMFETIGATTYRLALGRVKYPAVRQMLSILTRDESFHVPLNVHFIRQILAHKPPHTLLRWKLKAIYHAVFVALIGSSAASREVAQAFDRITFSELSKAYVENLGRLFVQESDLDFQPSRPLLAMFGLRPESLAADDDAWATSVKAAEAAVERENVRITAL